MHDEKLKEIEFEMVSPETRKKEKFKAIDVKLWYATRDEQGRAEFKTLERWNNKTKSYVPATEKEENGDVSDSIIEKLHMESFSESFQLYESTRIKESVPPNKYPTYGEYIVDSLLKLAAMVRAEDPYAAMKLIDFSKRYRKLINEYGEKIRQDGGHETDTSLYTLIVSHGLEGFREKMESY